jgi:hypothetical protein
MSERRNAQTTMAARQLLLHWLSEYLHWPLMFGKHIIMQKTIAQ